MAKVFVSRKIPGDSLAPLLDSEHEVLISEFDRPLTAEELLERSAGADAILTLLTDKINGEVVDAIGPQLKIVSNYAVGYDNISVLELTERGIVVTNTPSDEVNESVAEHAWALMLALSRRIVEADEATRKGAYHGWEPEMFLGRNLVGKTVGIIGLGRIGSMVAERAGGFGVKVLYTKRTRDEEAEREYGIEFVQQDELLAASDFVTLHVPLTDSTRHLINADTIQKMKKGAFLVNTARGPVVDEHALVEALRGGHLGGAGLDVFENEPKINAELVGMENVILTPHTASATWEARNKMGEQAVGAIFKVLSGEKPDNTVDDKAWEARRQ